MSGWQLVEDRETTTDGFLTPLSVTELTALDWELDADLAYQGAREVFTAPRGFRTDFASVPRWLCWLVPHMGLWNKAAVIHDLLCTDLHRYRLEVQALRHRGWSAKQAATIPTPPLASATDTDGLFRQMMRRGHVGPLHRWGMWAAVRWAALANPARRAGWWRTAPAVLAVTALLLTGALLLAAGASLLGVYLMHCLGDWILPTPQL